jgi:hypothetical protein
VPVSDEPILWLHSSCLLSKYGFNDGDEPDAWLDWCDANGIDCNAWEWHPILRRLVREHLLPKIDQRIEVYDIETIHNPIRASAVDGVDVDDMRPEAGPQLTPESVGVRYSEVLRVARLVSEEQA